MASPELWLLRHGATDWARSGRHTGRTDLPLLPEGEREARALAPMLAAQDFAAVLVSPLQRARRTCELAGLGQQAMVEPKLREWDYGDYEGLRSPEIRAKNPNFKLFRDGAPNGESIAQITNRADRVVARLRQSKSNQLVFSSGHFLRVLATRWVNQPVGLHCLNFLLNTASLSALSYEHDRTRPVIALWNDTHHLK